MWDHKSVSMYYPGNYRTQLYDKQKEEYLPATQGLGMFVEVKDPDEKVSLRFYLKISSPACFNQSSSFAFFSGF